MKNFIANGFAAIFILTIILSSCKTTQPGVCPEHTTNGNLGEAVNSPADEIAPIMIGNKLVFASDRMEERNFEYYSVKFFADGNSNAIPENSMVPVEGSSVVIGSVLNSGDDVKKYAASIVRQGRQMHSDLFEISGNSLIPLSGINSPGYESHPAISPDGAHIVFTSERPDGFGGTDLYISHYNRSSGKWSEPKNLGESVNSPGDEMTPFIDRNGVLYYSSNGFTDKGDFDLLKARNFMDPEESMVLTFPINSDSDEKYPLVTEKMIYFSSDRNEGCGGFDIYSMELCGPVIVRCKLQEPPSGMMLTGDYKVFDKSDNLLLEGESTFFGNFNFTAVPGDSYRIVYSNHCLPESRAVQIIKAPCSDTSVVVMNVNFRIPELQNEFSFEQYNVPFFVSGYYLPNTTDNLQDLRLKFAYNLVGSADSTSYIERPGEEYDGFAKVVDEALADAVNFILERLDYFGGKCADSGDKLGITIRGFADPRPISPAARYSGPGIDDPATGLVVERGAKVDNIVLSELRAYFTARFLMSRLEKRADYQIVKDHIVWEVEGMGVDTRETRDNEFKRRVSIKIGLLD